MSRFDYLVIGHVTHDLTPEGPVVGGTVAYAGAAARALGCRVAALTSAADDLDPAQALPWLAVHRVPALDTTTFRNKYNGSRRRQHLYKVAARLSPSHLPDGWERTPIVHLGPVAGEVATEFIQVFSQSMIGVTPQGWLRGARPTGEVYAREWDEAPEVLPLAAAVILSEEDVPDVSLVHDYRRLARLLVLTRSAEGATVFFDGEERHFAAPTVEACDETGAGDIFAAAFLFRLYQTRGNPWEAARFANEVAASAVTQPDLPSKMSYIEQRFVERQGADQ